MRIPIFCCKFAAKCKTAPAQVAYAHINEEQKMMNMQTAVREISTPAMAFGSRYMSLQEALHTGVTLEESKAQLERLINNHF